MNITVKLTPAQLRMVNSALAIWEAEDHSDFEDYKEAVMERTRTAVFDAMERAGVEP